MFRVMEGLGLIAPDDYAHQWRRMLERSALDMHLDDRELIDAEHELISEVLRNPGYLVDPFDLHTIVYTLNCPESGEGIEEEGVPKPYASSALIAVGLQLHTPFLDSYRRAVQTHTPEGCVRIVRVLPLLYESYGLPHEQAIARKPHDAVNLLTHASQRMN
jgi:hypothetical protein